MHQGAKRRRVIDEYLKAAVILRGAKGQASVGAVARSLGLDHDGHAGRDWGTSKMTTYLAACWRTWEHIEVVGISADASRFGNPQEETVAYAATDGWVGGWLPVQALRAQ